MILKHDTTEKKAFINNIGRNEFHYQKFWAYAEIRDIYTF